MDFFGKSFNGRSRRTYLVEAGKAVAVGVIILAVWRLVLATGGIKFAYSHLFYIGILLAAYFWGAPGGFAAGLAAGSLTAQIPLLTTTGEAQAALNWLVRLIIFVGTGTLAGMLFQLRNRHIQRQQAMLTEARTLVGSVFEGFSHAISEKDAYTGDHCQRVAHNAFSIGRQLGLPEARLQRLYFAGLLHDVGKIGVPDSVLLKPGKLTRDEFEIMKKHSPHGYKLIAEISDSMGSIAMGIRHHHERWDGKGYPDRATGEEIYLYGRIVAVADVFEALTTKRPYRDALPEERALRLVTQAKGEHFDPVMVDAFETAYKAGQIWVDGASLCWAELPRSIDEETIKRCLRCM